MKRKYMENMRFNPPIFKKVRSTPIPNKRKYTLDLHPQSIKKCKHEHKHNNTHCIIHIHKYICNIYECSGIKIKTQLPDSHIPSYIV